MTTTLPLLQLLHLFKANPLFTVNICICISKGSIASAAWKNSWCSDLLLYFYRDIIHWCHWLKKVTAPLYVVLTNKSPETVTTGTFGPSPSRSLDVMVTVWLPAVKVVVTVVITSSWFIAIGSLLQDEKVNTDTRLLLFLNFSFFLILIFNNWILIEFESSYPFHQQKNVACWGSPCN
jgi:hypothetical protein